MLDIGLIQAVWTVIVFVFFIGVVVWAYSDGRKAQFDEAAQLPFDEVMPKTTNQNNPKQSTGN